MCVSRQAGDVVVVYKIEHIDRTASIDKSMLATLQAIPKNFIFID
jgi:hypothetical protein